jgi:hypothetical protein
MRETLAEATATIEQVREVTATTARVVLTDLMAGHFMDGMSVRKMLDFHDEILALLDDIGVSDSQKAVAEAEWRKGIGLIYYSKIAKAVDGDSVLEGVDKAKLHRELQNLLDMNSWYVPSPHQLADFLCRRKCLTENVKAWIDDYKYYIDNNRLRNQEAFLEQ